MNEDYKVIFIKKKDKIRKIITYNNLEKREQHQFIYNKINKVFKPSIYSKGYIKNESIYTNVIPHLYNNYFFKTDIKDFFQSINHKKLIETLYDEIKDIASPGDCYKIVEQCSYSKRGLPLGFITSPLLANIYLKRFDINLYSKLKQLNCKNIIYTRYADDIMISFKETTENLNTIKKEIEKIISDNLKKYYLKVNKQKTKFIIFEKAHQVRLTGITIVEKNNLRRISVGRNQKRKFFYDVINRCKSDEKMSEVDIKRIKGKLSFYLSIEKKDFENFITNNMKQEIEKLNHSSFIELINNL